MERLALVKGGGWEEAMGWVEDEGLGPYLMGH